MGSGANGYNMDEFNGDNFDHSNLGFFGGGNISCGNSGARPIQSFGPLPPGSPTWGSGWKAAVKQNYNRVFNVGMQGECAAYRQNYADLDPTYRDAWGDPLLRITFNFTDNERKMVRYVADNVLSKIVDEMQPAIKNVNNNITNFNIVPYQSTHTNGGTVMGADPGTSVTNKFGQVWGTPNLFVLGASNFPQNGGYNPTGTAGALAYHAANALITRYVPSPGMLA
jgi:gluconate 2-dehydrogenase alpha chain